MCFSLKRLLLVKSEYSLSNAIFLHQSTLYQIRIWKADSCLVKMQNHEGWESAHKPGSEYTSIISDCYCQMLFLLTLLLFHTDTEMSLLLPGQWNNYGELNNGYESIKNERGSEVNQVVFRNKLYFGNLYLLLVKVGLKYSNYDNILYK